MCVCVYIFTCIQTKKNSPAAERGHVTKLLPWCARGPRSASGGASIPEGGPPAA